MSWGSVVVGILGLVVTAVALGRLSGKAGLGPRCYWALGLAALFPAWLLALLALLGQAPLDNPQYPLPRSVIFSSGSALIGAIAADFIARRLQGSGKALPPVAYWLLGLAALIPAWCLALWSE